MVVEHLSDLKYSKCHAVIINYNTKLLTTLTLVSALRYCDMPVTVIDCHSSDGSFEHFSELMKSYEFNLLSAPLREHGVTLDWVFREIPADNVLAIDSDLEILNGTLIEFLRRYIDNTKVFGCGFINGPGFLNDEVFENTELAGALYDERPWMPIVMLKVEPVRKALKAGISFAAKRVDNEYSVIAPLNHLRRVRFLGRILRYGLRFGPSFLRHPYHTTILPSVVYHDTGSLMYRYLRYAEFMYFAGLPEPAHTMHVSHYFGATRSVIDPEDKNTGSGADAVTVLVCQRLKENYGIQACA